MSHSEPSPDESWLTAVLVPGLGLDDRAWSAVRARLAIPSRTVALPSLGRRRAPGEDLAVEAQAGRLLQTLRAHGVGDVVLVGHSASCAVVAEAATRSRTVVGLVLVGPVTDPRARTWPRMLSQWLRTARSERLGELPLLLPQYRRTGAVSMVQGMDAVRHYPTDTTLARLRVPVVVVRGAADRIAAADWSRHLARLAGGRLDTVAGAAHMVPITHPGAVVAAIAEVTTALCGGAPRR